jgi:uncharacterized protein (TIGR02246 family)
MWLRLTISSFLAAVAIAAGATGPAFAQDDAQTVCNTAIAAYEAAVATGDPAKVADRFMTDGTFNAPEGIFQGRQAIAAYMKPGAATKDSDTLKYARQVGNSVVCSGGFVVTLGPGAPVKELIGNYTKLLTKSANDWLIADLSVNYAPPLPLHR